MEIVDEEIERPLLEESVERSFIAGIFGGTLSRDETKHTLQRALDMLQKPKVKPAQRDRRSRNMDAEAKALLRAMTGEASIGSTSDEESVGERRERPSDDPNYCDRYEWAGNRNISVDTMKKVLEMHARGDSVRAIKAKYSWYTPKKIPQFRRCIETGGSPASKLKNINEYVLERVQETIRNRHPLHDYMIRNWGERRAAEIGATDFQASTGWLYNFKTRNGIVSRKITEYTSRAEVDQQSAIASSIEAFRRDFASIESQFRRAMILNMDQTGFSYEIYRDRTLTWKGSRNVTINIDQQNKRTHSYTAQPIISRDGNVVGKLLLCLQEPHGRFGPIVSRQVRELEERYRNIVVFASSSGKMSTNLTRQWISDVLLPSIRDRLTSIDTDTETISDIEHLSLEDDVFEEDQPSRLDEEADRRCHDARMSRGRQSCILNEQRTCLDFTQRERICLDPWPNARCMDRLNASSTSRCYNRPHSLLLLDAWGGHSSEVMQNNLRQYGIRVLMIPKKTTGELQPLDVTFMRQYKRFVKLVTEEAILNGILSNVTSRDGIINLHSLIWNQFGSEAYTDMLRYAWRNTDPSFENRELSVRPPPPMVQEIQFNFDGGKKCEIPNCNQHAFIRCSHCKKHLCLNHFLGRKCFHPVEEQRAGPSGQSSSASRPEPSREGTSRAREDYPQLFDEEDDDDFDPDLFANRASRHMQ